MAVDTKHLKKKTLTDKIDKLLNEGSVSDYEFWLGTQSRIQHKRNLSFQNLENRLKDIFKTIDAEIFIDKRPDFERIKKKLLKASPLTETKLRHFLTDQTMLEETCKYIREVCMSEDNSGHSG